LHRSAGLIGFPGKKDRTLTSSRQRFALITGTIAVLLIAWLLIVQLEEFAVW
jgi:hypothetical protein